MKSLVSVALAIMIVLMIGVLGRVHLHNKSIELDVS